MCYYRCCFFLCDVDTVCCFTTGYLDVIEWNCTARCCTTYAFAFINILVLLLLCSKLLYCCCGSYYCLLPMFHRGWDSSMSCCCPLHQSPVFFFFPLQHDIFSMYTLAVLSHLRPRFEPYNSYHIWAEGTGMRGAKVGVSPPRRSPPCIYYLCRRSFS